MSRPSPRALVSYFVLASTLAAQPPLLQLTGENPGDDFGWSVAAAGDVNGDGQPDIIVGAPSYAAIAGFAGRAYVFYGPFTGPRTGAQADATISATTFGDNLGIAVSSAGDVNGDGFADVLIGARGNDAAGIQAGRVYLFLGPLAGALTDADADAVISGQAFDEVGRSVAPAGDLNGDDIDDIVVGAPVANVPAVSAGAAHVFYGPVSGARSVTSADATIIGTSFNEMLGQSLAAGDLDGDGADDLVVGAPRPPLNGTSTGRVHVFFGPVAGTHGAASADVTITGEAQNDEFGQAVAIGDVDGDGSDDLIVGADQFFTQRGGRVYVFRGPLVAGALSASDAVAVLRAEAPLDDFGIAVASGVDLNGDGNDDVIVGADGHGAGSSLAGRAYLFFGPLAGNVPAASADLIYSGATGEQLGGSVAAADLGSGPSGDVLIGALTHPSFPLPGAVKVVQPPRARVDVMTSCTGNAGTLTASTPVLGGVLTVVADGGAANVSAFLLVAGSSIAGWPPCGIALPGIGEILISLAPPNPIVLPGGVFQGAPVAFDIPIPQSAELLGAVLFAQGLFADIAGIGAAHPLQLTGGLALTLGL